MDSNRHDELHDQNLISTGMLAAATFEPKKAENDLVDGRTNTPKPRSLRKCKNMLRLDLLEKQVITKLHFSAQRKRKDEGCFGTFMGMLADMMLTTDEDKIEYLKSYNCMPPPIFILLVSITEVSGNYTPHWCDKIMNLPYLQLVVFIYFSAIVETKQWITLNEALLDNVLVYDPYLREQVWRFISYMLLHAG